MSDKRQAGVWMDNSKAIVAKNHGPQDAFKFFLCDPVTFHHQHGNSNENAAMNAEKTNKSKFFKSIEHLLINTEQIYVFGPGTIQEEFKHHLEETPQFKNVKVSLGVAAQLSEEQVLHEVKEHFGA